MFENKKINLIIPVIFAGVLALGMFLGYKMPAVRNSSSAIFFQNNKEALPEVLDLLKYKYVDSISLDEAQETAIMAMLKKLDPHTVYIPANLVKQMNQDLEGNFEGIGIEFNILHDTVHIMNVIPGGPSEMVGLLTGDKILYVNDTGSLVGSGISSEQVRSQLLGPSGTMVKTTIQRGKDTLSFQIKRGRIPLYSNHLHGVYASHAEFRETRHHQINRGFTSKWWGLFGCSYSNCR
jgi:carboxyl-terminal processing protease